ncbi:replication-relaxation family protein [Bailinhaonella thermotolerans]|uniref:Replication-relaxation n=1 Tax=Bailinhaonella thermotolerans TaxID=1070861 RepID=A0A3A4AUC4_9ACTN|nr:replication-relaxation family protein [Bailinhaonella thermotolerans]RJL31895.1 hypothetical protein D5H75_15665 [Bailinhaonella thermotolerans]
MTKHNPAVLAGLAVRLTHRDRTLMHLIWEHRVLTSPQIAQLAFDSDDTARKRLLTLHRLGVLERFAPRLPPGLGTAPYHYVLGEYGAAVLAAEDGLDTAEFGYRRDRAIAIAYSHKLAHTVGVNGFFTALTAHANRVSTARLITWWPEHRCTQHWGDIAQPDAYGRWTENGETIDFFLEYDTGTETLDRVVRKLDRYTQLHQTTGIATPILFWLTGDRREANLRKRLQAHPAAGALPIATASRSALTGPLNEGPAADLWLPLHTKAPRRRLARLTQVWPHPAAPRQLAHTDLEDAL